MIKMKKTNFIFSILLLFSSVAFADNESLWLQNKKVEIDLRASEVDKAWTTYLKERETISNEMRLTLAKKCVTSECFDVRHKNFQDLELKLITAKDDYYFKLVDYLKSENELLKQKIDNLENGLKQ